MAEKSPRLDQEKPVRATIAEAGNSAKELAKRVSNTSEEMAEYAWRYALAEVNHKAHGSE